MAYNFDRLVNRKDMGSLKEALMPKGWHGSLPSFDGAEMDFETAPSILHEFEVLVKNGLFGYTLIDDAYRQRVCRWMQAMRDWTIQPEWIVPASGTIHSVANTIRLITEEGDNVLVQSPEYPRYAQAILRLSRKVLTCPLKLENNRYEMDWELLEEYLPKAKLMIFCNPHNPSGRVWSKQECERLSAMAKAAGTVLISDEIFAEVVWDGHRTVPCGDITITSLGKTFNLTGVNHANVMIQDEELRTRWIRQRDADHYGSLDPWVYAAVRGAYSEEGARWVRAMLDYVNKNRESLINAPIPGLTVMKPEGTYVAWMKLDEIKDEETLMALLREAEIIATPGSEYGGLGWFRMNLATPHIYFEKALNNLYDVIISK